MTTATPTASALPSDESVVVDAPTAPVRLRARDVARSVGARIAYWLPVFAALALFAQVAFLGLRPAISEARRLAAASDVLEERWARDRGLYDAYELQVRVRQDPIFVERQRRLRRAVPAANRGV